MAKYLNIQYLCKLIYDFFIGSGAFGIARDGKGLVLHPKSVNPFLDTASSISPEFARFLIYGSYFLYLLTLIFILLAIYYYLKFVKVEKEDEFKFADLTPAELEKKDNEAWDRIKKGVESESPADWKFAVLAADNMLDDMTKNLELVGMSLGERLKSADPSSFQTLNDAWEAHKVRNRIAHETGYVLTKREARATIERFGRVFEEFKMI
ncbi:MAG: hypothetical protein AAB682_01770 [Patescibacteria group bacterium]